VDAVEKMIDTVEMTDAGKSSISNVDTRSNPWAFVRQVEKGEPLKEWVEEEFYEELWMCPEKGTRIRKSPPTLVWVRRDLVDKRNFTEGDCYLLLDGDTPGLVREMILSGGGGVVERWEETIALAAREEVCDGRLESLWWQRLWRERGRWRAPFYPDQHYPLPSTRSSSLGMDLIRTNEGGGITNRHRETNLQGAATEGSATKSSRTSASPTPTGVGRS
jgi:hypothetical protein